MSTKKTKKTKKAEERVQVRAQESEDEAIDNCLAAMSTCALELQSFTGADGVALSIEHPAVEAAIDGKRGVSAAYIASIVSALVSYEQSCGWKHLISALNILVKFIRWARKNRNKKEA